MNPRKQLLGDLAFDDPRASRFHRRAAIWTMIAAFAITVALAMAGMGLIHFLFY